MHHLHFLHLENVFIFKFSFVAGGHRRWSGFHRMRRCRHEGSGADLFARELVVRGYERQGIVPR